MTQDISVNVVQGPPLILAVELVEDDFPIQVSSPLGPPPVEYIELLESDFPVHVGYPDGPPAPDGGFTLSNFVVRETPQGDTNGSNPTFSLAHTPLPGTESVYVNGLLQHNGANMDYTLNGNVITFNILSIPDFQDKVLVSYIK